MNFFKERAKTFLSRRGHALIKIGKFDIEASGAKHAFWVVSEFSHKGKKYVFASDNRWDLIQREHIRGRIYEPDELEIIARHIRPGAVVLDIGANIGNHSVFFVKALDASQVIAIEPGARQNMLLSVNTRLNETHHKTRIHGVALSDREGTAELVLENPGNLGSASLGDGTKLGEDTAIEVVDVVRGDDLLPDAHVDFIKLDAEGHELAVLSGLKQLVARCRPTIFIEIAVESNDGMASWCEENRYRVAEEYSRYEGVNNQLLLPLE